MIYLCGPEWDRRIVEIIQQPKTGIIMSGGLDSYVLYSLLSNPLVFNIRREDKFDNASRVRELVSQDVIEIDEVTTNHWERVQLTSDKILKTYDLDVLYYGINHTPPLEYFPEFDMPSKPGRPWKIDHPKIKAPFLHLYKYHIIDLGMQLNLDLDKTLSCLTRLDTHCGKCWQCMERQWGFDQLKKN